MLHFGRLYVTLTLKSKGKMPMSHRVDKIKTLKKLAKCNNGNN